MNSSIIGASGDAAYRPTPPVYQVCPHCKRLLNGMSSSGSKGFCDEHGEVTGKPEKPRPSGRGGIGRHA